MESLAARTALIRWLSEAANLLADTRMKIISPKRHRFFVSTFLLAFLILLANHGFAQKILVRGTKSTPNVVTGLASEPKLAEKKASEKEPTTEADPEKVEFFENKIRPVLIEHCYKCHSSNSEELGGNLLVDSKAGLLTGGDLGPAIIPSDLDESILLSALKYDDLEMPPDGKLSDATIRDFEKWIADGAVDPRENGKTVTKESIDLEKGREFWCFQPIESEASPAADLALESDIDRFIYAKLKAKGLTLSKPASQIHLLERVYFDLVGLPPSPKTIEAFTSGKVSYSEIVDQLLASRRFGERFGRHWLDVARYADSSGGGRILLFNDAWRYRDYVIDSFNQDKPFDRFLTEQLAGDLIQTKSLNEKKAAITATGFLMLGPHNYELQDKELLRMEVVDEQINVMSRAFMGMTVSCARCHDHKFDPIPTADYYALAGIFRSTKSLLPGNVSNFVTTNLPLSPADQQRLDQFNSQQRLHQDEIKRLNQQIKALGSPDSFVANDLKTFRGSVVDDFNAERKGKWTASVYSKPFIGRGYHHSIDPTASIVYRLVASQDGKHSLRVSHTAGANRTSSAKYLVEVGNETLEFKVNQKAAPPTQNHFTELKQFSLKRGQKLTITLVPNSGPDVTIADAVHLLPLVQQKDPDAEKKKRQAKQLQQKLKVAEQQLATLMKSKPSPADKVMSVRDETKPEDFFVCIRGNVHKTGEPVKRNALRVVGTTRIFDTIQSSGRLELAKWLTNKRHPLTARVYANRIWSWLFDQGIVDSPDNFGQMGSRPTHPMLLDFLANDLMQNGWSTKKLIRKIVLSKVYRQSSEGNHAQAIDPRNQFLASFPAKRLSAESIRDRILSLSGKLDLREGGPAIKPNTNSEFGYDYRSNRRSVYLPVFRNTMNDLFEVFDFANPNLVSGKRNSSTLPTQALYMMNSKFVMEHAAIAAKRVIEHAPGNFEQQLDHAYQLSLSRDPTATESKIARQFFGDSASDEKRYKQHWDQFCQILISSIDFQNLK